MLSLLPPVYNAEYDEWSVGHGGSNMRLNIQLFTMTKEEHEAGDYSRLEYEKMDTKDLLEGGSAFQAAKNIDAAQYDLSATIKVLDDDDDDGISNPGKKNNFTCIWMAIFFCS